MCGIAGIVGFEQPVSPALLAAMNRRLVHRGPDDGGEWVSTDGRVGLANRRLAILDRSSAGHQPMSSEDGAHCIAFNGEIYNYIELRDELRRNGHVFRTGTDTEVILHAYRQWGTECVSRLNGMFAFAIWDAEQSRLFATRDRFGEKPFYYHHTPGQFLFASEIKALLADPTVPRQLNPHAVARFLTLALVDGEETTFFANIKQLPPAHILLLDARGELRLTRYWDVDLERQVAPGTLEEHAEEFRALFRDSVRLRLRSDVPVGSSLSGGLDSSSIVCTIRAMRSGNDPAQNSFSARYTNARCDEGQFIDAVTAQSDVQPHMVWVDSDQLERDIDQFVWHQDEPVAGSSPFAQWKVMELAAQAGVTVLLDGQGADEVVGGYPSPSFGYRYAELARGADWSRLGAELAGFRRTQGSVLPALRYLGAALLPRQGRGRLRARFLGTDGLFPDAWRYLGETGGQPRTLKESLYEQVTVTSLPSLLRYCDRNSMAFSRESRLPFLDHRLVEFAFSLPSEQLVADGVTKVILREAMRGTVPQTILQRTDKVGFATPERDWMTGPLRAWMTACLDAAKRRGLVAPKAVDREWTRLRAGGANSGNLWRIVNLELWCRKFIDAQP